MTEHRERIAAHYKTNWGSDGEPLRFHRGPIQDLPQDFCVLKFKPSSSRQMWTYATCCMSQPEDTYLVELHVFSPFESEDVVEVLTAVAHYHRTGRKLDLGHTVNLGRPWISDSLCDHGFISLPYLDGPKLENLVTSSERAVSFYWLIPVTKGEVEYKKANGSDALEAKFEAAGFDYLNPNRSSVV